ncbi:MAG: META domain-containing protein [Candidatus Thiothrix singaporensis]|uniref:META domain-containing protein n=1 Tax=Candidatus Thiothrix singaporensis TaxID=2799669 RepID=A0A7L6AMG8_9GAMM|nr:MAG: META domain-containing protein [Candidatus Thiothrix singaporensis]
MKAFFASFAGQVFSVLVVLAIVSACTLDTRKAELGASLEGTNWNLKSLDSQSVNTAYLPTISFETSRITGYGGCNRYFGNYTSSNDGVFSTHQIGATKMACNNERDQLEQRYLEQLSKASLYAITREQLHILDNNRKILMVFTAAKPATTNSK